MTRDPRALVFDRLVVHRMPGIADGGFTLDGLAAGVTIVHGPNASGKTTTASALESVLWPRTASPPRASLGARFHLDGDEWTVEVDGRTAWYRRAGRESGPPALPADEARDRYRLSLHELLSADDRSFADAIVRESAGGYDVARAAESLHLRTGATRRVRETDALEEARKRLRAAYAEQDRLQAEERRLAELDARLEAAAAAAERARLLERAVEYADAVAEEAEASAEVASFPPALARLRGDEAERLAAIRDRLEAVGRELDDAERERRAAEAELSDLGLPDGGVDDGVIDALRARLAAIQALEQSIAAKARELEGARARAAEELRRIGEVVDEAALGALDIVALDSLADLAQKAGALRAAMQAAEARVQALSRPGPDPETERLDLERLGRAVHLLQRWLRAGTGDAASAGRERRLRALGAAAAGLLTAAGLGGFVFGALAPGAGGSSGAGTATGALFAPVVAIVLALVGAVLLVLILRPAAAGADPRELYRRDYERLGLERPRSWTPDAVGECLDRLEARRAEVRLAAARAEERAVAERELDEHRRAWAAFEPRCRKAAERFGVAPALDPVALHALADRISRWQDADGRATELAAELERLRSEHADARSAASDRLGAYGYAAVADAADLAGAIDALSRRVERHRRATSDVRNAESRSNAARKELAALTAERRAIFERAGLAEGGDRIGGDGAPGDRGAGDGTAGGANARDPEALIREWCALHASYREATARLQSRAGARSAAHERLTRTPGYVPGIEDRDVEELRAELAEAVALAAGEADLREEIAAIRRELDLARRGHAVEDALAEVERCEAALREAMERDILGVVGSTLVAYVQRAARDEQRPAVFRRAQSLFSLITRGRYRLDFDDGDPPAFRAIEERTGASRALDELSSATRVQLLLAVRLAFVECQEAGVRLPLIFDETLGNSDDDRAAAIMDAIVALAAEGRQIFYFTAQPDEVGKWRGVLERADGLDWAVIDLAEVRRLARHETSPPLAVVAPPDPSPPPPDGMDHDAYGLALRVPGIDLSAPPGAVHLWHLVDDPELLYRLLAHRLERWGELRSLVDHGGGTLLGEDVVAYPRIRAAARALEVALELARVGRGRPVDRDAIEASGAVTETFLPRVLDLLEEVEGDAARLIRAIEGGALPRFRTDARERLREFLEERGYIDTAEPIEPDEIRARVLAEVALEIEDGLLTVAQVDRILAQLPLAVPA